MKKIAIASALLASMPLAACQEERPAPAPTGNFMDEAENVFIDPAPYPGDRK